MKSQFFNMALVNLAPLRFAPVKSVPVALIIWLNTFRKKVYANHNKITAAKQNPIPFQTSPLLKVVIAPPSKKTRKIAITTIQEPNDRFTTVPNPVDISLRTPRTTNTIDINRTVIASVKTFGKDK